MTSNVRVLHPITRLIVGGAQENTMLTAQLLDNERWDVDVISGPQTGLEGSLIESVRERGIPLTIEPTLVREISPINDILATWRLYRHIKRGDYQIVHTHSSKAGILGRWAAKWANVPIIIHTVHGWGHHDRQNPLVRWFYIALEKLTLPITDKLIVVSKLNIEKGLQDGIGTSDDYVVIRSGIELERFMAPSKTRAEMRTELGIPLDAPVIGTVTRMSPQKAPLDFVAAAAEVAAAEPTAHFVMVGDGLLRADVEKEVRKRELSERFHFTGLRRDVPELLTIFDIFALSSLWEGLPRVLPQAMAAGLPLAATSVDGNAEIIQHGVNGLLTPPGEPDALAKSLLYLLQDKERADEMGRLNQEEVEEYGATKMVADIDKLYQQALQFARSSGLDGPRS